MEPGFDQVSEAQAHAARFFSRVRASLDRTEGLIATALAMLQDSEELLRRIETRERGRDASGST